MVLLLFFFVELFILSFLSKSLINSIYSLIFYISKSKHVASHFLAFIFLPGTIIHELAHVISAGILMVPTGEIEFIPEIHEGGVKLGSAEIGKTDPLRRSLIGIAPVLAGILIILGGLFLLTNKILYGKSYSIWIYLGIFYGIFVLCNTMFSSKKDLEGVFGVVVGLVATSVAVYLLGFGEFFKFLGSFLNANSGYIYKANLFMLVPISVNILLIFFAKLISKFQRY